MRLGRRSALWQRLARRALDGFQLAQQIERTRLSSRYPTTRELTPPDGRPDPARLRIHWVVPDFSVGDGGHAAIFRIVSLLDDFGHGNTLWIHGKSRWGSGEKALDAVRRHFSPIRGPIRILESAGDVDAVSGDLVVATDRWTAYLVRFARKTHARAYLVQDFEPWFYPRGAESYLAESTYRFGFYPMASSPWLLSELERRFGQAGSHFEYGFDQEIYSPAGREESGSPRVIFYSRSTTPRRAVPLAKLALERAAETFPDLVVDFFGGRPTWDDPPYHHRYHGMLQPEALAELYRKSTVGMVFSSTNPSLVPKEMMACGLPVLDLDTEATRATFPSGTIRLAPPDPSGIAVALEELLGRPDERQRQRASALDWVQQFTWERTARQVESGLLEALGMAAESRSQGEPGDR